MILSNFAERLSELIFENNLTTTTFAEQLGCERSTINQYLNERKMPALDMVIKMADFFKCTTDFLLGLEEENYSNTFAVAPPFKERLRFLCEFYNVKKSELIEKAAVPESGFYYWLKGTRNPTIESVERIANALGCSIDFALGRSNS